MSQINSNFKDDVQIVLLLSYFVGHAVLCIKMFLLNESNNAHIDTLDLAFNN